MSWRLLYKDSNNDNQELAGLDYNEATYTLKRARGHFRNRRISKVSFLAESDIFKNIPRDKANFGTDEPGIFYQADRFTTAVVGVDTANDEFVVSGDRTDDFEEGGAVDISGSTGNDGIYKVLSQSDVTYDSNNDETTIAVVEDVTDSTADGDLNGWENIFRGFTSSQGKIVAEGTVKFKLLSFEKYIGKEDVTTATISTDIKDAFAELVPSDYTLDAPSSSNVTYIDSTGTSQSGFAPVDSWSLNDERGVGFRELTRDYGYTIKFKADKTIRYEPVGFASSIDTIDSRAEGDTSNTRGKWMEWTADDTELANKVNTIKVTNSKNGNKYDSGVITNSTSVQKFGKITSESGLTVKKGYVDSDTEAKRVAYNILRDEQNPTEGGRVAVPGRYTNNVSNSTFTLNDSSRDLNGDTFTAWSQVNFYPENKTELHFQFENQTEEEASIRDDVRAERSTTFPSQSTDVGNQNVDADTEDVTDQYDAHDAAQGDHDVAGQTYNEQSDLDGTTSYVDDAAASTTFSNGLTTTFQQIAQVTANVGADGSLGAMIYVSLGASASSGSSQVNDIEIGVTINGSGEFATEGTNYPIFSLYDDGTRKSGSGSIRAMAEIQDGDTLEVNARAANSSTGDGVIAETRVVFIDKHFHNMEINQPSDPDGAQPRADGSTNNTNPSDSTAGDTTSLNASGSTDPKNVDVATEDKTDR